MSLILRRRALMMDSAPPPPPVLWDYQNPALNQAYEPYTRGGVSNNGFTMHEVVGSGTQAGAIRLAVLDDLASYCFYSSAVFGPYNLTSCSKITLIHDRHYSASGSAWVYLGIWQPEFIANDPTINHPDPNVGNYETIATYGNMLTNQSLEVDITSVRGAAYIVPEIKTFVGNSAQGGILWVKRLTVS